MTTQHYISYTALYKLYSLYSVACVAGAKRGGRGGGGKALFPYPLPLSTPATQANTVLLR